MAIYERREHTREVDSERRDVDVASAFLAAEPT